MTVKRNFTVRTSKTITLLQVVGQTDSQYESSYFYHEVLLSSTKSSVESMCLRKGTLLEFYRLYERHVKNKTVFRIILLHTPDSKLL